MANVTRNTTNNEWDIDVIPGEQISLTTAGTYVDGDMNITAVKVLKSKFFDDVWSAPLDKTTAEAKAMNSKSSSTQDGSTWSAQYRIYFGKIRVTGIDKTNTTTATATWDMPWHIRMRVTAKMFYRDANGNKVYHADGKAQYDWNIYGNGTTYTYSDFNNKYNWTPIYYHMINRPQASYMKSTSDSPILWGINFNSTNGTYSNRSYYKREFSIDVIELDGCDIEFLDDWQCVRNYHRANPTIHPRSATTYYYGYCSNNGSNQDVDTAGFTDYDAYNNGLRESGDDNSTQEFYWYTPVKAGGQGLHGHAIIGQLEDGTFASFTTTNGQSSASVTKTFNSLDEFVYGGHTLYYNANNNIAAGSYTAATQVLWNYYSLDTRYVSNYYGTAASSNPSQAFGWSGSGTTAAYTRGWIKVEFTDDHKRYKVRSLLLNDRDRAVQGAGYYMLIGSNYSSTGEYYRIATLQEPRIYYVDESGQLSLPNFGQGVKVFVDNVSTPYDVGDVWLDSNGTFYCINARASGDFDIEDWKELATGYLTNDEVNALIGQASQIVTGNNGGNIVWHDANNDGFPDEVLVLRNDNDPSATVTLDNATFVIKLSSDGITYSNTGYRGTYSTILDPSGRGDANFLQKGTLDASKVNIVNFNSSIITRGVLKRGSSNNQSGTIEIYNESGILIGEVSKSGFKFYGPGNIGQRPYMIINDVEFFAAYDAANNIIFKVSEDIFNVKKISVSDELSIAGKLKFIPVTITQGGVVKNDGIAIVGFD